MIDLIRHSNNRAITLTKEIANSGEGKVWQTNLNGYLAKIYHDPTPFRIDKLKVMLANPPTDPMLSHNHVSIAWISDLLKDSDGQYVGFLMPAIENSKPLSSICNPKLRKRYAPGFNWYYLHVTALNTAWIIQAIHAKGYVLGDIKLENILVNDRAMTAVIDTDSFQVRDTSDNKIYFCTVGSEGFTPPELIGKDFHQVKQSQNQDRFRLGVLIHYLLFGYHPFSGNWTGVGECPEQTELIKQGYWYGRDNSPIRESNTTIPLNIVHPKLKRIFLRCFNDGHEQSHLRPTAKDWHEALETAVKSLTACDRINNHYYSRHCGSCYWCDRAGILGVDIFPGIENIIEIDIDNFDNSSFYLDELNNFSFEVVSSPKIQTKYHQKTSINNNQSQTKTAKINSGHSSQVSKAQSSANSNQILQCITWLVVIVILPVVVSVYVGRVSSQNKDPVLAQNYIKQGLKYYNADEYQQAIEKYTHAIELDSNNHGYFYRGNVYYDLNRYREAIEDYTQAIVLDPDFANAYHKRGVAHHKLGNYQEAIEDYTHAININPNSATDYHNRGFAYNKLENHREAIDDYTQAIVHDPNYATAYNNRGDVYYQLENYQEAIDDYTQAIVHDPNYATAYNNRGFAYNKLKNYREAIENYTQVINIKPDSLLAYYGRGFSHVKLKNYREAIKDYTQVINIKPNYALAYYIRGTCYVKLENYQEAIEDFTQAINIDPNYALAYNNRGFAYINLGDRQKAARDFRKAASLGSEAAKENISYYFNSTY